MFNITLDWYIFISNIHQYNFWNISNIILLIISYFFLFLLRLKVVIFLSYYEPKQFNKEQTGFINYDLLNAYLLTKQSSCTRLFFEREKKENKDYNKEMIDEKEDEEMLKLEVLCAPNKVCLKCSKIFDIKNEKYIILKYYDSLNSIQKHIYKYHPDESKNQLVVNVDFINENLILIEKDNKMNFYLVWIIKYLFRDFPRLQKYKN